MNRRPLPVRVAALFSCILMVLLTSCADRVDVYYSSSLNGNLLGCDCRGYPEAGLDKRTWYLKQNPLPEGAMLLDAGNVLETGRDPYLAGLILESYAELGYHAVSVGTHELAEGIEILIDRSGPDEPVLFLAHNLVIHDGGDSPGQLLTANPYIHDFNGLSLAVVSLVDPEWFAPYLGLFNGRLSVADPAVILDNQRVKAAAAGAEAVILLAHGSELWVRGLMAEAEERDPPDSSADYAALAVVILAGEEKLLEDKLLGGIPLLSPGEEGNRLGILELRLHSHRRPGWKNDFIEFHYLGPGDKTIASRGAEYAAYLDEKRSQ